MNRASGRGPCAAWPRCPVHAAIRHLRRLRAAGFHQLDAPLAPTTDGSTSTRADNVELIRRLLLTAEVPTTYTDPLGTRRELYGGHACRVAGAQFLAAQGVPINVVQLLGRWSSRAVERYTQSAPLALAFEVPALALHGRGAVPGLRRQRRPYRRRTPMRRRRRSSPRWWSPQYSSDRAWRPTQRTRTTSGPIACTDQAPTAKTSTNSNGSRHAGGTTASRTTSGSTKRPPTPSAVAGAFGRPANHRPRQRRCRPVLRGPNRNTRHRARRLPPI